MAAASDGTGARTPTPAAGVRWVSVLAFGAWLLLCATTWGYLPFARHAWGFKLLVSLPLEIALILAGLGLLLTTEEARRGVLTAASWLRERAVVLPPTLRPVLGALAALALVWLLRDRFLAPDMERTVETLLLPGRYLYPEPGGLWLMGRLLHASRALGLSPSFLPGLLSGIAGGLAVLATIRAARWLSPEGHARFAVPLLAFSGGVGAAVAGRVDLQPFLLASVGVYYALGLRHLATPAGPFGPAIALGVAIWLEPFALLLLPGLLVLLRDRPGQAALGLAAALAPLTIHVLYLLLFEPREYPASTVLWAALGGARGWVRGSGIASDLGTDYVFLGVGHLKYLANAGFVLAGGSIAVALGLAVTRPARSFASRPLSFLLVSLAGLCIAAATTRPLWGPWDWELFATTGLTLAFVAGAALDGLAARARSHVLAAVVALQLCFVGIPLVAIGFGDGNDRGPLIDRRFDEKLPQRGREPARRLAPWL